MESHSKTAREALIMCDCVAKVLRLLMAMQLGVLYYSFFKKFRLPSFLYDFENLHRRAHETVGHISCEGLLSEAST